MHTHSSVVCTHYRFPLSLLPLYSGGVTHIESLLSRPVTLLFINIGFSCANITLYLRDCSEVFIRANYFGLALSLLSISFPIYLKTKYTFNLFTSAAKKQHLRVWHEIMGPAIITFPFSNIF